MTSTLTFADAPDGTRLAVRRWEPAGDPWAALLIVHGVGEHSGRYEHAGDHLAKRGLLVTSFDHRHAGQSEGERPHSPPWDTLLEDIESRLTQLHETGLPVAMWGHSLGGLMALDYAISSRPGPDCLVLTAPALGDPVAAWQRRILLALGRRFPRLTITVPVDPEALATDPAVGHGYLTDPLVVRKGRLGGFVTFFTKQDEVTEEMGRLAVPTLVLHGGRDRVVPPPSTVALGEQPGVLRILYPALLHELHNEPNYEEVLDRIADWLQGCDQTRPA